jgi:pimeloyl-ACP methyl ester carboxylesterase
VFDFGAPVGFRLDERHSEWIAGLIVQNGNAYTEGLSEATRDFVACDRRSMAPRTPSGSCLDLPGRKEAQVALAFDYHSNLQRYDGWQAWLRRHTPPTLIAWGRNDPFFLESGARAYLRDLPGAELHLLDTGHFALEEKLPEIAPLIADFLDRTGSEPLPDQGVDRPGPTTTRPADGLLANHRPVGSGQDGREAAADGGRDLETR